jgi:hypothetical protein
LESSGFLLIMRSYPTEDTKEGMGVQCKAPKFMSGGFVTDSSHENNMNKLT